MNPFRTLDQCRRDYRAYVESFQRFRNGRIREFVRTGMESGDLLWREPLIQINRRFKPGTPLEELVRSGQMRQTSLQAFRCDTTMDNSAPIRPFFHQTDAFRIAARENRNFIVATGTGSGKSFCFGLPVIDMCLKLKERDVTGIKVNEGGTGRHCHGAIPAISVRPSDSFHTRSQYAASVSKGSRGVVAGSNEAGRMPKRFISRTYCRLARHSGVA